MRSWWNQLVKQPSLGPRRPRRSSPGLEFLEDRLVPSSSPLGVATPRYALFRPHGGVTPLGSPGPVGLSPAQVRTAYGVDQVTFGAVQGDGSGQTIAIIDA